METLTSGKDFIRFHSIRQAADLIYSLRYDRLDRQINIQLGNCQFPQKMHKIKNISLFILVGVGLFSAFLSGFFLKAYFDKHSQVFPILDQAYEILLNHEYYDLPDNQTLEHGMIRGMLAVSGDQFATFQEPVQHELETNSLQGNFGGIGVDITQTADGNFLLFPIEGGPAYEAGILNGDKLIAVGNMGVSPDTSIDEIKAAIRGKVGEAIKIVVFRDPGNLELDFNLIRTQIHLPSVIWHIVPDHPTIGIIKINIIAETTVDEIEAAIAKLQESGTKQFILDLRDNGGGLLTAGVDIARLFLEEGLILEQQYRGEDVESYPVRAPGPYVELPLVLLVNQNTASAAEIVAGALQVYHRAHLVGQPTFGKDTIQLIFNLQDDSSLHVTAARWWIPGIESDLGSQGLQPDIAIIDDGSGIDLTMNAGIQALLNP